MKTENKFILAGIISAVAVLLISGCVETGTKIEEVNKTSSEKPAINQQGTNTTSGETKPQSNATENTPQEENKSISEPEEMPKENTIKIQEDWCNKKVYSYTSISGLGQAKYEQVKSSGNYELTMISENIANSPVAVCCAKWNALGKSSDGTMDVNYTLKACNDKDKKYSVFERVGYVNGILSPIDTRKTVEWVDGGKKCKKVTNKDGVSVESLCWV